MVHSSLPWFAEVRLGVVGFILFLVDSLGPSLRSSGSFGIAWVYSGASGGRRIQSGSSEFTRAHLALVGFIRDRVNSLTRKYRSYG